MIRRSIELRKSSHQASHIHIAKSDLPEHSASGNSDSHTSASDLAHHSYFTCLTCSANENSNSGRAAHASDPTYHTALTGQVPWSYNGHATFPELEEAHGKLGSSSFPPLTANFPALESGSRFADEHQQNQLHFHHGGQILSTPSPSTWNNGSSGDGSLDDNATGCGVIFNDAFGEFTHGNDSTFPS